MSDSQGSAAAQADVTIVIPSLNQGAYLEQALASIFAQGIAVDVRLMDAGSTDCTRQIIERWSARLSRWRSAPDHGQAWAINEGLRGARSRFVTWLNADDCYVPGGLRSLVQGLDARPGAAFAYGQARLIEEDGTPRGSYHVEPWNVDRFARRCFVSQPAALIRRECWEAVGGLDPALHMALDYDLWWRLAAIAPPVFVDSPVAAVRIHHDTKTMRRPMMHYREATAIVRRHYGRVPVWWWAKMPVSIGARLLFNHQIGHRREQGPGRR